MAGSIMRSTQFRSIVEPILNQSFDGVYDQRADEYKQVFTEENGINRGPGLDSRARYIYIHGSNHENRIGEPLSKGCIRLTNRDVIDLFDRVDQGDYVVIV